MAALMTSRTASPSLKSFVLEYAACKIPRATQKPLYSKSVLGSILLDVLVATTRRGTVLDTMIKDTVITGRVLLLVSRIVGEENDLAQFEQVFGLQGD